MITARSPAPSSSAPSSTVAITVNEPAPPRPVAPGPEQPLDLGDIARGDREPRQRVDEQDHVRARLDPPPCPLERQPGDPHLLRRAPARRSRSRSRRPGAPPARPSPPRDARRPTARRPRSLGGVDRAGEAAKQRRATGAGRRPDEHALPEQPPGRAGRPPGPGHPPDRGPERPAAGWQDGVSSSNSRALERLGLDTVHPVDVDQGAMALAPLRRPRRPRYLVTGAKLAAPNLGGRDVDVVGLLVQPLQPQEAEALGHDLQAPR